MSFPRELDEYDDNELVAEIKRRNKFRALNVCDYCARPDTFRCKVSRHSSREVITLE